MASIHVTNSNPNISKPADACSRALSQKFTKVRKNRIVLIWLKFKDGISWTPGKGNYFRGLQATSVIRTKREVQSRRRFANGAEILLLFQGAGAAVGNSI